MSSIEEYVFPCSIGPNDLLSTSRWDIPFTYFPLRRPIPRDPTQFPFISEREDWPLRREEIGGWTITPFGGRGRFKGEMVEIEGLVCLFIYFPTSYIEFEFSSKHSLESKLPKCMLLAKGYASAFSCGPNPFQPSTPLATPRRPVSMSSSSRPIPTAQMFSILEMPLEKTGS